MRAKKNNNMKKTMKKMNISLKGMLIVLLHVIIIALIAMICETSPEKGEIAIMSYIIFNLFKIRLKMEK
jgi:hypothetical protein